MYPWRSLALFSLLALLGLAACGGTAPAPTRPLPPPNTTAPAPTVTPPPTATRPPTPTARPSATPTDTPPATAGPTAHSTVAPTAQPTTEPTATPRPTRAATNLPQPTATPQEILTPISDLPNLAGQEVTVRGNVVWISSFSKGFKFLLDDDSGRVTLLLWTNVYRDCWAAPKLLYGATVQAHGTVGQYEGEWQIVPDFGGEVKVTVAGGLPPARPIASVTAGDVGTVIVIEGTVSRAESFSQGQRVYVDDGSGELLVLLWQNVYDLIKDNVLLLAPGTRMRAGGIVEEYKGSLELVPQVPYSVVVNP